MGYDDTQRKSKNPLTGIQAWYKARSPVQKLLMGLLGAALAFLVIRKTIKDHSMLFFMAEASHMCGIGFLVYKLVQRRSVSGLSLESQLLTATYLTVRLICSLMMESDWHTVLDALTLLATAGVIFCMLVPKQIKQTYQRDQDRVRSYYVIIPCLVLAWLIYPTSTHWFIFRGVSFSVRRLLEINKCMNARSWMKSLYCSGNQVMWAFCVYLEAVSVLPQLRMMQKAKVVERFTAHYVFLLAVSRFLICAHWLMQIYDGNHMLMSALRNLAYGMWPAMILLAEFVQTTILSNFCYYYLKSYTDGSGMVRLPSQMHGMV